MTEHPITPPPELRRLWAQQAQRIHPCDPVAWMQHVSTQGARWGAGQELKACCEWADATGWEGAGDSLRAARRPKPQPPADGEVAEVAAWLRLFCSEEYESRSHDPDAAWLTRAAELLEQRHSAPVPVLPAHALPTPEATND